MRYKKLVSEQIAAMLQDLDLGMSATSIGASLGVTREAVKHWKPYAGLDAKWLDSVKLMEARLKRLATLNDDLRKQVNIGGIVIREFEPNARKRARLANALIQREGLNRQFANRIFGLSKGAGRFVKEEADDQLLIRIMRRYRALHPGQGFDRMYREALKDLPWAACHGRRLYNEMGMRLPSRGKKVYFVQREHKPMEAQGGLDRMWSMDFMVDVLSSGKRFWVLNVIDDFNRECIVSQISRRRTATIVLAALEVVIESGRRPKVIRTDNGAEFKSRAYKGWADKYGIFRRYIQPSVSSQNAYIERFNRTLRDEVLNAFKFRSMEEAQRVVDDWRIRYNFARPHMSLGGLSPLQYAFLNCPRSKASVKPGPARRKTEVRGHFLR